MEMLNGAAELLKRIEVPQTESGLSGSLLKEEYPLAYQQNGDEIKPQFIVEQICELTRGEAIITRSRAESDVGCSIL